jgi:hypothetical protein
MSVTSNWNDVRQGIIDAMTIHSKDFKVKALVNIKSKLDAKGVNSSINNNSVEATAVSSTEYNIGKVYFDEVFKDINKQSWIDSI